MNHDFRVYQVDAYSGEIYRRLGRVWTHCRRIAVKAFARLPPQRATPDYYSPTCSCYDCVLWREDIAGGVDINDDMTWLKVKITPNRLSTIFFNEHDCRYYLVKQLPVHKFTESQRHMRFMG